uniref:Uncharacterized protein n=1 Tax=Cacopsylla melanoneura TaxID=428564 RepID=A0A8D9AY84_9HEMI
MTNKQIQRFAHALILAVISVEINGQFYPDGLQHYFGQAQPEVIKPVQEETDDNPELNRYYRAEPNAAQPSLQFQPVQYDFQSPAFTQQQLQPQAYYQQQQLLPQTVFQQPQPQGFSQPQQPQLQQPQQLRSLQGFADPTFQQDYKYRMIYANQENPTPPPPPQQVTPGPQQAPISSPFQFQPPQAQLGQPQPFAPLQQFAPQFAQPQQFVQSQFTPQPQQFAPQPQQFAPQQQQQQFAPQPQPFEATQPQQFTAQPQPAQSSRYSSAGAGVSKTTFTSLGASYSF